MQELFTQYYGLDWLAMIMSLLSMYYIGNKKRIGLVFGLIAGITWVAVNILINLMPGLLLNIILITLNIRAYIKWGRDKK
jgi:nicotinamide riboside transporter PnuC